MLNKKVFFALIILIFSGLLLFFLTKNNWEKVFVVLPHHNLVDSETDKFYANIKEKYSDFENIVLISPNHFWNENNIWFTEKATFCYKKNCVNWEKLDFLEKSEKIFKYSDLEKKYFLDEHWIWNHFKFLEKYFKNAKVFSLILKINTDFTENNKEIFEKLKNYKFSWKTLFVASVDFSHHTNEKAAIFHDLKTYKFLTSKENYDVEVDCPNCLYLIKNLAYNSEKKYFNLQNRTSVDTFLNMNSNFENTTHFYWEFLSSSSVSNDFKLFNKNNFQNILKKIFVDNEYIYSKKEKFITFSYFPDFINYQEKNFSKNTKCFYSNKDFKKNPNFWFNRVLYSFDLNILNNKNIENLEENKKEELKNIWFNYLWQKFFENKNFLLINLKNSEIEKYLEKIKQKKSENKKIIILTEKLDKNLKNILLKEKVNFIFTKNLEWENNNFEKNFETNIFYTKENQAIFWAIFWEKVYFETMNFDIKDWFLDCESFN